MSNTEAKYGDGTEIPDAAPDATFCRTIGCDNVPASALIAWPDAAHEPICDACADSYQYRTSVAKHIRRECGDDACHHDACHNARWNAGTAMGESR